MEVHFKENKKQNKAKNMTILTPTPHLRQPNYNSVNSVETKRLRFQEKKN